MAFVPLPAHSFGREPRTVTGVAVASNGQTRLAIPLSVLEQVGFPTANGSTYGVAIGEGADAGKIAIAPAPEGVVLRRTSKACASLVFTRGGKAKYAMHDVIATSAQNGLLILTLPADFPWKAPDAPNPFSAAGSYRAAA